MNRWLLLGLSAAYAGVSVQAAFAANPTRTGPAPSMAAAKSLHQPRNFDASLTPPHKSVHTAAEQGRLSKPRAITGGLHLQRLHPAPIIDDHYDKGLNKSTFVWAGKDAGHNVDFAVYRQGEGAPTYAKAYLRDYAGRLGIGSSAVNHARLVFVHDDGAGPVIVRYQQVVDGYDVMGRQLNVIMDQELNLVAVSGYFASAKGAEVNAANTPFHGGPQAAMNAAFKDLNLPASAYNLHRLQHSKGGFTQYAPRPGAQRSDHAAVHLTAPVGAKKVLFPVNGKLVPGWLMTMQAGRAGGVDSIGYAYVASADGSRILYRKNLIDHAAYTYRVFADPATRKPLDSPFGNDTMPWPGHAVAEDFGAGALVDVTATQGIDDPWLPMPVAGAPTNETTGNNVWAYLDIAGGDGQDDPADISATTTSGNTFDYLLDFSVSPTQATNAQSAVVNLFYIDNWLHDAWYNAGFTEAVGNAQYVNYGRGGVAGDPIHAEAQDFSGRNNANMFTPPDGSSPRQQMYLWNGPVVSQAVQVTSGGTFAFDPAFPALFGPKNYDITGDLAIYNDGVGEGSAVFDACEPTSQDLTGKVALIADIFTCRFDLKVSNAEAAGAIGAIIVWNDGADTDNAFHMGGDNIVSIPSLGVSDQDANPVIDAINAGNTVALHMALDTAPDRDGSLDTQVVAHEFFHYVSNRLVGNALGLSNQQGGGMGEGWSDIAALLLTARPDDLATNPDGRYTEGGYVVDNFFTGLRAYPYSTDMNANPLTFADITSNPEVHFVGTVWATMLWEAYVGLYKHYSKGNANPMEAYRTAKTKMMNYIIEGLMATPNAPTMIEARDAILAAAKATSSDDYEVFVTAFAKRGMGFGAVAPPRDSTSLQGVKESYDTDRKAFVVQDAALNVNAEGVCDADYSLDPGETGEIKLTLMNIGSANLTGITAQLSSDSDITFSNGGKVTFEPDPMGMFGGTSSATATATVNSADETSEAMAITVSFPDVGKSPKGVEEPGPIQFQFISNQDFVPGEFTDDVEHRFASLFDWTRMLTGDGAGWSVDSQFSSALGLPADNHYWYGPDNDSPTDIALVTPPIKVGRGPFSVSFYHYYQFESSDQNYDGGVVEITTDGGAHWTDVTKFGRFEFGYNGTIASGNPYLGGRPGFVNVGGTLSDGARETISFGGRLGGKTIQLRFRVGSDAFVGEVGWIIDDVTVNGATEPMFSVIAPEDAYCER